MKKFLLATVATGVLLLGGQAGAEASVVERLDTQVADTQDMSKWTHFRDKYILDRDPDRRHRRHRDWYDDDDYYRHRPPPPPSRHGYGGPPPPPPPVPAPGYGAPPPPPSRR